MYRNCIKVITHKVGSPWVLCDQAFRVHQVLHGPPHVTIRQNSLLPQNYFDDLLFSLMQRNLKIMCQLDFVTCTHTRVPWEKGTSIDELPPSVWLRDIPVRNFIGESVMPECPGYCGKCNN